MELSGKAKSIYRLQDYAAQPALRGVERISLKRFRDSGGAMCELMRIASGRPDGIEGFDLAQINYSTLQPGVTKAFHVHKRQTDVWFVPPEDRVLLILADVREGSATEGEHVKWLLGDGDASLVRIPPGVAHGCRNLGSAPARILYFTDVRFSPDPADCDEGRLPWDFLGADAWEIPWD